MGWIAKLFGRGSSETRVHWPLPEILSDFGERTIGKRHRESLKTIEHQTRSPTQGTHRPRQP